MEHASRASSYNVKGHTCGLHERFLTKAVQAGSSTCLKSLKHILAFEKTPYSMLLDLFQESLARMFSMH